MGTIREENWQIKRRADVCAGSGRPFEDGQGIVTRLFFTENGYVREDFDAAWWDEHQPERGLSAWKSVFRVPPAVEEVVKKENAESLLRDLIAKEDTDEINVVYILAVMLERKRVLAEKDTRIRDDGVKLRFYEHRKTGETFVIIDPELKLTDIQKVQQETAGLLGGDSSSAAHQ